MASSSSQPFPIIYVLLSGGIDSTTCLSLAIKRSGLSHYHNVRCVSIDYGQRHKIELEYAKRVAGYYGRPHQVINLPVIPKTAMLTNSDAEIPNVSYEDLPHGISPTYVPFRNGLMLSTLTSFIQGHLMELDEEEKRIAPSSISESVKGRDALIYFGAHAEDSANWAYPDCTPEFSGAIANAIFVGSYQRIRLEVPLQHMTKAEIIRLGTELGSPYHLSWSCYRGGEKHCGVCPTCRARKDGFTSAKIDDPTDYAA